MLESISDYRKIVLLTFLILKHHDLRKECGLSKSDIYRLNKKFKNFLIEQNEEDLDYIKNQEESINEKTLTKSMEQFFATFFRDIRHERSLIFNFFNRS